MADQKPIGRLREHRIVLNKLLRDDRISPNRRLLAQLLAMMLDANTEEDRQFLKTLMLESFAPGRRATKWTDDEDPAGESNSLLDQQSGSEINSVFDQVVK